MTKKHFIALADAIREHDETFAPSGSEFTPEQLRTLAGFCKAMNFQFNQERWLDYIAGKCGKNGGKIKPKIDLTIPTELV